MSISGRRVRSRGLVAIGAAVSLAIYMAVIALPASAAVNVCVTGSQPEPGHDRDPRRPLTR